MIRRMDEKVAQLLRSSVVVSSVAKAVQGMMCWLLGADGCETVTLDVSMLNHTVSVASNTSLSAAELEAVGARVERGEEEFLRHLGEVSEVAVSSKHPLEPSALQLRFGGANVNVHANANAIANANVSANVVANANVVPNANVVANANVSANVKMSVCGSSLRRGVAVRASRLFWNVPVRRQLLPTRREWDAVRECVLRAAVARPDVAFALADLDAAKLALSVPKSLALPDRLAALFGPDTACTLATSELGKVSASLYVIRGLTAASRVQYLQVNGFPVDSERLIGAVARDLSSFSGPVKMGSPRVQPSFVLQVCDPDARLSSSADLWFSVSFKDLQLVLRCVQAATAQIVPIASPLSKSPANAGVVAADDILKPAPRFSLPPLPARSPRSSPVVSSTAVRFRSPSAAPTPPTPVADILSAWVSPTFSFNDQLVIPAAPTSTTIETIRLHKDDLSRVRFVGQMDRKFLVTVVSERYLVAFDQHAVHERILLENLLAGASHARPKMVDVTPPIALEHDRSDQQVLPWFRISNGLLTGCAVLHGEKLTEQDCLEYLGDLAAGHGYGRLPNCVHRLLAFKACRNAVKFGDELDKETAVGLMQQLRKCDFPFICAHGRTSFAILALLS